jgi:hypothetical protein
VLEKPRDTGFDAPARPATVDHDEEVITVAGKPVAAPYQFLIPVV